MHGVSFTEPQIQTLLLTNAAGSAVAFDSALALRQGLDPADVEAIRAGGAPRDPELAALSMLARSLIETRGKIGEGAQAAFLAAGSARNTCSKWSR